jgi:Glycosyltransferase
MVGALQERKNFRRVLEVWKTWERTGRPDDLGLVIIGSRESIFSSFKLDYVPEGVQFMDKVSDEILPKLYSSAVAFLFPSLYEGFGIPILEAMACGTPVITSNVTSMPEVADKAALLINPELHVSILQAMQTISSDGQLRDELRVAGLERAQQFSWERTALQTREVLEQAARRLGI